MFAFKGENSIKLGLWSTIHTPLVVAKDIHCVKIKFDTYAVVAYFNVSIFINLS